MSPDNLYSITLDSIPSYARPISEREYASLSAQLRRELANAAYITIEPFSNRTVNLRAWLGYNYRRALDVVANKAISTK